MLAHVRECLPTLKGLIAKGCNDTELNFAAPFIVYGDQNPTLKNMNALPDKSCDVFDVNGGGIVYKLPPKSANDTNSNTMMDGRRIIDWWPHGVVPYLFCGAINIENIGTLEPELLLIMPIKQLSLCEELNRLLGVQTLWTNVIVAWMGGGYIAFSGFGTADPTYYSHFQPVVRSACAKAVTNSWPDSIEQPYVFYHLLIAR